MFFFSILSSNVFRVYIFNATLIINLNHISQTNTYPLNLYKMKMVRESILDIDFKKLMQMNRTRYLLIVFSEKITYTLYIRYIWKTFWEFQKSELCYVDKANFLISCVALCTLIYDVNFTQFSWLTVH